MLNIDKKIFIKQDKLVTMEHGQSITEFVVITAFALIPLFFFVTYTGKWGFAQLRAIEAARYVAWERIVWRKSPPSEREWTAIKSDADLRNEAALQFFGMRGHGLTHVSPANSRTVDPLLTRHDGQPLLQDLSTVYATTREEVIADGVSMKFLGTLIKLTHVPLHMTGPTSATVSVQLAGLPGYGYLSENPLAIGPQITAQAAVLTDAWTANGPDEETRVVKKLLPSGFLDNSVVNTVKTLGATLFPELNHLDFGHIDPEIQYGDRLQPYPSGDE